MCGECLGLRSEKTIKDVSKATDNPSNIESGELQTHDPLFWRKLFVQHCAMCDGQTGRHNLKDVHSRHVCY
jgi:hypothetical protein